MIKDNLSTHQSKTMKLKSICIIICISLILSVSCSFPESPSTISDDVEEIVKVLFIGHSYTFWNDMPFMLQQMTIDAGEDTVIEATMYADGGASLRRFWTHNEDKEALLGLIAYGDFDYVIMQ
ncbi:hypothetical protein ACFL6G_10310, partial [candidate division KSB1 bacterium]